MFKKTKLRNFTKKYCKKKAIKDIDPDDLDKWAKLTEETDGAHLAKYMARDRWDDSPESLAIARWIIKKYAPPKVQSSETCRNTMKELGLEMIKADARRHPTVLRKKPRAKGPGK